MGGEETETERETWRARDTQRRRETETRNAAPRKQIFGARGRQRGQQRPPCEGPWHPVGLKVAGGPVSGEPVAEVGPSLSPFPARRGDSQPDRWWQEQRGPRGGFSSQGPPHPDQPLNQLAFGSECACVATCVCGLAVAVLWPLGISGVCVLEQCARGAFGACRGTLGACVCPVCPGTSLFLGGIESVCACKSVLTPQVVSLSVSLRVC